MCGIMGYIGNGEAVPVIIDGLSKLEYRGYDSAGIAIYQDDCVILPPVFIHADARVSTSIIGPFASIGAGAVIQNSSIRDSILSPGVHITNTHLEGSILGHDVVITGMMGKFNLGDNSWVSW